MAASTTDANPRKGKTEAHPGSSRTRLVLSWRSSGGPYSARAFAAATCSQAARSIRCKRAVSNRILTVVFPDSGSAAGADVTLQWLSDPTLRQRSHAGLNKGEASNALRRAVFFHRQGEIRDRTFENQSFRASGLSLITAAIVHWNTVYLDRAV